MKVTYDVDDIEPIVYFEYKKIEEENSSKLICTHYTEISILSILKSICNIINRKLAKESYTVKIIQTENLKTIIKTIYDYPSDKYSIEEKLNINKE